MVLVEQLDQRAPIAWVLEWLGGGVEEDTVVASGGQLVVDAAHKMHVGEIVELHIGTHVEGVTSLLGRERGQKAA